MTALRLLFLLVLFGGLVTGSVRAQVPELENGSGAVVAVMRLNGDAIQLDGMPDEPVWEQAAPATNFRQRDPRTGEPATERTEVRVLLDANRLILGVMLYDSEPGRILGNQMQRDQPFFADDRFIWTLDTFLDGRSGYYFEVNPSGAMGDGLIDPASGGGGGGQGGGGIGVNKSWDGIWTARVRRGEYGWSVEVEIPFRTLNFDPNAAEWGINFQRTVRRKNEESVWTGFARNQNVTRMSNAGRLTGLSGLSQGLGLSLVPYVVGSVSAAPGRGKSGASSSGDIGLDAFYNITPALRANLSVNTDFAETEVDQRQVNLTRFPLFFQEKRAFFLEGSNFFDFSREQGNVVVPFFSRRIGLDKNGVPQPIDVGAKLTGQVGQFDLGVLHVRTGESGVQVGEDFSVVRLRRRTFRESYLGALYTRRAGPSVGQVDRQTAGTDFELRTSTFRERQILSLSGMYLWTSNPAGTGNSSAYAVRLNYPNDPITARVFFRELQEDYDPAVGFVQRRGIRRLGPRVSYTPRPRNHPWIRQFQFVADLNFTSDMDNRSLTREHQFQIFNVQLHSGDEVTFEITPTYERIEDDFEISNGVVLPAGSDYSFTRYQVVAATSARRMVSVRPSMTVGSFYSGSREEYSLQVGLRPRPGMSYTVSADHNVLNLAEGAFETNVYRVEANTQFGPWTSLANTLQYDTVTRQLGWQMRFRFIRRPGNDLYFVYTHNWQRGLNGIDRSLETLDNRAATKFLYTVRF